MLQVGKHSKVKDSELGTELAGREKDVEPNIPIRLIKTGHNWRGRQVGQRKPHGHFKILVSNSEQSACSLSHTHKHIHLYTHHAFEQDIVTQSDFPGWWIEYRLWRHKDRSD